MGSWSTARINRANVTSNLGFGHDLATELIAEAKKCAQSSTHLAEREGFEPVHLKGLQSESKGEKIPYDPLMPPDLCTDCTQP